jgi:hypothetical protein
MCVPRKLRTAVCQNCVRYPLKPRSNTVIYSDTNAHRCCEQSLMESGLMPFGVRQRAWAESISKRAHSGT